MRLFCCGVSRSPSIVYAASMNSRLCLPFLSTASSFFFVCFFITVALCATDPSDIKVMQDFLKSISNSDKLSDWTGDDPCGDGWSFVHCMGTRVTELQLKSVGLQGLLPPSLNQLSNLQQIALQGNAFSGPLPSFKGLSQLSTAYLGDQLFSSIPADFFTGLSSLTILTLQNNPLNSSTGWSLPSDIASASGLATLTLTNVSLRGPIPDFLGNLTSLQELRLSYNQLTGTIPPSFANLQQLSRFELNNQALSGPIDVVGAMPSLKSLWLHVNSFSGAIPASLGLAVSLQDCRLNDNELVGVIPSTFATSSSLQFFSVENNKLLGAIPQILSLNASTYITTGNNFCASEAGEECNAQVTALLSFLAVVFYPLDLVSSWAGNDPCLGWEGIICDAQGKNIVSLNLPNAHLNGTIAPAIANLTSLTKLVLSGNSLTGAIPNSLTKLNSLVLLDVSNNNIYGPVPIFDTARVTVIVSGNPNINSSLSATAPSPSDSSSSSPSTSAIPTLSSGESTPNVSLKPSTSSFSVGAIAGVVVGGSAILIFAAIAALVAFKKRQHSFQKVQRPNTMYMRPAEGGDDADTVKVTVQRNTGMNGGATALETRSSTGTENLQVLEAGNLIISIELLRTVTDNFSEKNMLGRGGFGVVYKGELDDGTKIAVKRMLASMVSNKGLNEFQAEIAVLTKVRHRHLVALLGYCMEDSERLLVYEFMPLGTLSQHLFEWKNLDVAPLSWEMRLSIALDVARGLEYLHGLAHKSFIHRDLKPSNILLGDDYRAKVSDFGLVKLAPEGKFSVETRLAGTFGYLAPEYAVTGRVTTKVDVFSFGVVLMELLTGRKALDETQPEANMHLVTWFRRLVGNKGAMFSSLDPTLGVLNDGTSQSILIVAELAGHCTSREPYNRPDMSHAVNVLSPLVEQWTPSNHVADDEASGIDLHMTLPQALKRWQAFEGSATSTSDFAATAGDDVTHGSMPACPSGLVQSFTTVDGR